MIKDEYLKFVEQEATKIGKRFILDTGEGNDFIDSKTGWYIENLSGWLVDAHLEEEVLNAKGKDNEDNYIKYFAFVYWKKDEEGNLFIEFKIVI